MQESRMNLFDIVLLVVGVGAAVLGFQLINQAYRAENGQISWLMIIAIFNWLALLVMFILLSVMVDVSKRELVELKNLINIMSGKKKMK